MSQAANTFWVNKCASSARVNPAAKRRTLFRRFIDGVILAIILAACAICVSVYMRSRSELDAAKVKNQTAAEKLQLLAGQVEKIERDVKQLQTDDKAIESLARQKYGYVRAGDVVIKVQQDEPEESPIRVANLTSQSGGSYTDLSN